MKTKILESLKTKFKDFGVKDSILDGVADKLSKTVTTEDQIETAVGGVTFETLSQAEIDRRVTEASETARKNAVKDYEKKHNLKDGNPLEKKEPEPKPKEGEEEPAWAKALREKLEQQDARLAQQEKERESSTKRSQAEELIKGSKIPEKLHKSWLKRIDLDNEETSLEDQVKALEEEHLDMKQEFINQNPGGGGEKGGETSDADMDNYLKEKFPEATESQTN